MKKLQLKKEIIVNLDNNATSQVKGGNQSVDTISTVVTWGPSEMMCQTLTEQTVEKPVK